MEDRIMEDKCGCNVVHEDVVNKVRQDMLKDDTVCDLAEFFKVFGDVTRLKILKALISSEMCVCDLTVLLSMNQSAVSHQLKILRQSKIVKYRKEGKIVYYSLDDEHIEEILNIGLTHIGEA